MTLLAYCVNKTHALQIANNSNSQVQQHMKCPNKLETLYRCSIKVKSSLYPNSDQAKQNVLYKIREHFYKNILYRKFKELFKILRPRINGFHLTLYIKWVDRKLQINFHIGYL